MESHLTMFKKAEIIVLYEQNITISEIARRLTACINVLTKQEPSPCVDKEEVKVEGETDERVGLSVALACINVLTKQEPSPCVDKEEVKVEVERYIDLARQMEAFFLQKRFLLSAMKPELLVKEDNNELKCELQRKDELLRRHCDKIGQWQTLLADLQLQRKDELLRRHCDKIGQWQTLLADLQGHTVYNKCQQAAAPAIQQAASPMPCAVPQTVQAQQMAVAAQQALQQQAIQQQQVPPPAYPNRR
ncbi:unnamed protein product [Plutella xylostella]|uniref:Mediator of RNA polymerase II transcription subunit 28 n=1 Tax=Plutella xylostella TaxID=51655 RepID=A0A8S4DXG0_PLUXY|nr:unnamed protein product [Plutella xylostella]